MVSSTGCELGLEMNQYSTGCSLVVSPDGKWVVFSVQDVDLEAPHV